MKIRFSLVAATLLASTFTALMGADGGCGEDPPILDNNGFDLWCGNRLCYWEVEAGTVSKAPTWHRSDYAANFGGAVAAISQHSEIDSSNTPCLQFRAVADVELSVSMVLEIDYFDDGVVDVTERIPTSSWARIEFQIATPEFFEGARFRIRKEGNGRAALAEMQVNRGSKCSGARPQLGQQLAVGSLCDSDAQCVSSICAGSIQGESRCSRCEQTSSCSGSLVCGVNSPDNPTIGLFLECMEPNQNALGTVCHGDDDCASTLCVDGFCSSCAPDDPLQCLADQTCAPSRFVVDDDARNGPSLCVDNGGSLPSGGVCGGDYDCASSICDGSPLQRCSIDRRECDDGDDCPGDDVCATVAIVDGTCR